MIKKHALPTENFHDYKTHVSLIEFDFNFGLISRWVGARFAQSTEMALAIKMKAEAKPQRKVLKVNMKMFPKLFFKLK